ncbi:ATP-dependent transcriptional regulator [Leptolyngbya sp. NIES-3755]|nr:ATP-dependent transcriptional regulator [Leptolyngbya sp. NIES-3755]
MIVPFFSVPPAHHVAWVNVYAQQRSTRRSRRSNPEDGNRREFSGTAANLEGDFVSEDALWGMLLEAMPLGVLVLASSLSMVYCNEKAKALCDRLRNEENELPISICQLCQRLIQGESSEPLIMEYQEQDLFFRLQARWMNIATPQPLLLVLIEDCHESMRNELAIEQDKYDLTDREAEIWFLLRQKYSYQDISALLNISMNTVKTHVKNIYAKRKSLANDRKIWYSR